ncbi:hypothetical protein [Flavobacterium sp. I3-2]|uniref:hypothetical protein n=1 Tax=Flavobacterium sp. I3-2 TaxID=2748319 RepID=UPI0015AE8EC1|nr:hypothetical protein [Flavobacterium sp. I3-2]
MRIYPEEGFKIVEVSDTPPNKFYAFMETKSLILIFLIIVLAWILESYFPNNSLTNVLFYSVIFLVMFYVTYVNVGNYFRYENVAFTVIGKLHFYRDYIDVNGKLFDFTNVYRLDISNYDYVDKFSPSRFRPSNSYGISNYLIIHYRGGVKEKIQFIQNSEIHLKYFRNEFKHYYDLGLLDIETLNRLK